RREPRFRWAEDGTSTLRLSSARRKDRPELSSRWPRSGRKRQRRTRAAAVSPRLLRCVPARSRREQRRGGVPRSREALRSLDRDRVLRLHSRCRSWPHADLTSCRGFERLADTSGVEVTAPGQAQRVARKVGENEHVLRPLGQHHRLEADRKSTRLNSSHVKISYAVFC